MPGRGRGNCPGADGMEPMDDNENGRDADQGERGPGEGVARGHPDPDTGLPGLSSFERAVVDRAERERATEAGRNEFGRYARAHPRALPAGGDGGRREGDDLVDTFISAAADFELDETPASQAEREVLRKAIEESQRQGLERAYKSATLAHFIATVPDGGIKTNRNNEWVITLVAAWEDRHEVARILDTIPMNLIVTIEKPED